MPKPAIIYKLFIASPGDIKIERKIIREVVSEWNKSHGQRASCRIETTDYTDAYPEYGDRPQAIINKQVFDHSDIVVALFWTRFGVSTGVADSGTEEEILRAISSSKPLLLYFSDKPMSPSKLVDAEDKRIENFRHKHQSKSLYENFDSNKEFRTKFKGNLTSLMNTLAPNRITEIKKDIHELHHINLVVSNLKESIDFYCDRLGLRLIKRAPFKFGGAWFGLPNGQHLHLVEKPGLDRMPDSLPQENDPLTPPSPHFALLIEKEQWHEFTNRAKFDWDKKWIEQPFSVAMSQFYILDPDNYLIEITDITEEQKRPRFIERSEWEIYSYWWRDGIEYPGMG